LEFLAIATKFWLPLLDRVFLDLEVPILLGFLVYRVCPSLLEPISYWVGDGDAPLRARPLTGSFLLPRAEELKGSSISLLGNFHPHQLSHGISLSSIGKSDFTIS
jgi:hypothetical protein